MGRLEGVGGTRASWDAIVIGGGPAGASTTIRLEGYGCRVLLLEAERFPRAHVGESLVSLWSIFDLLGVTEEVDATFQHKRGSCRVWGKENRLKWTEFEAGGDGRRYSLQVERALFDQILLRRAEAVGAAVWQSHRVEEVLWDGDRAVGVRYRTPSGICREARAPWVVDASGRSGLIPRMRKLRRVDPFYPDLSVYGYFADARRFDGEQAGNLLIEAVSWGWFWFIPLHTGEVSVGLVCDRSSRSLLRELGVARFFAEAVASSTVIRPMLAAARLARGPTVTASHGYFSQSYAGPGWLLAGDAGCFVDPMWATGVANALTDGILAASVIEAVAGGRVPEGNALAFYNQGLAERDVRTRGLVRLIYRSNHLYGECAFWQRRHGDAGAQVASAPIVRGLSADPSLEYFMTAFRGMGIEDATLAPLEDAFNRLRKRGSELGSLLQDLDTWIPMLGQRVTCRRGLGFDGSRLVEGLTVDNDGVVEFTGDRFAVAALEALDGERTALQIVNGVAQGAPGGEWLLTRSKIIALLARTYEGGVLDAHPAPPRHPPGRHRPRRRP